MDADACPVVIRDILCRAAQRTGVALEFVANRLLKVPTAPNIRCRVVSGGLDAADQAISAAVHRGDLVISADIPLVAEVMAKGAEALNPRGERYSHATIAQKLAMRDLLDQLRGSGIDTGGSPPLHARDRMAFANQLDRWLATLPRRPAAPPEPAPADTP